MGKDYYAILGVSKTADDAELKKGTHTSAKPRPPTTCPAEPDLRFFTHSLQETGHEMASGELTLVVHAVVFGVVMHHIMQVWQ